MLKNKSRTSSLILPLAICSSLLSQTDFTLAQEKESPVAAALKKADFAVQKIVAIPAEKRTFDNTIGAIDDLIVNLRLDTEYLQFMAYVSPNAELRDLGNKAERDVRNWLIALSQREDLYKAVQQYVAKKPQLEGEQARLLKHTLRDYRRAGMNLSKADRDRLKALKVDLNKLSLEFEKNIREDETRVPLSKEELKGMSEDWLKTQPRAAGLYLVGMDYPSFLPLMDYCENETTRKKVWIAYKRRGGEKNVKVLERILVLRAKIAKLLGYQHPADFETEIRMAKSAENVLKFYQKLRPLLRKKALIDWQEFTEAKRKHTGNPKAKFYPWDQSFYEKRLMKNKYAVDSEKVREYFPLNRVIEGLFSITQSLYGLEYRDVKNEAAKRGLKIWHPDVKVYDVFDKASGDKLGTFYLDMHPRPNKYGHAAQWGLYPRKVWADGRVQKPLAALVCNFTKPTADKPSLLSHDEVETFFHEFGHCLHSILTEAKYGEFSGTSVARDFVEAPSQMFENWVWDAKVLKSFARHYKTGEVFPDDLLQGMIRARYLGSGMKAEHQVYYGMVDLTYHMQPDGKVDTTKVQNDLFGEIELYDPVPGTHFQSSFGHLTGYQAGYYGYLWSLVYAQDMFERFKQLGMLNPKAGMYYRKKILARGGTMDAMDMVRDYLGREPRMEPFLKHLGLQVP
ncbi:MAG: oligopeptidase A [Planctomycetaceae bacterium]